MNGLEHTPLPELAGLSDRLRAAHDAMAALRSPADTAVHQPKPARDPQVVRDQPVVFMKFVDALVDTAEHVEAALKLIDPVVDQMLAIKRAAWSIRANAGSMMHRAEVAVSDGTVFTPADVAANAEERGKVLAAWALLAEAGARADAPAEIVASLATARSKFLDYMNGELKSDTDALGAGRKLDITLKELGKRNTVAATAIVDTAKIALNIMVAGANDGQARAAHGLWLNAVLLVAAVLLTAAGVLISLLRVSLPIRRMTAAMRRLAGRDTATPIPGVGRGDEIGAMAAAVAFFRDEMIRATGLEAQAAAEQAEKLRHQAAMAAERQAQAAQQEAVIAALAGGLSEVAVGDLTQELVAPFAAEYDALRVNFNEAVAGLQAAMQAVLTHSRTIDTATGEIAAAADDLARRTEQQAAGLQQTAAALAEVTATVGQTAEGSDRAKGLAATATATAERSGQVISNTASAMGEIANSARQIGQIIGVIDEIAFQTNLIALNAGVEAARAGEAGRGFAVVAQEVRALAQRAADSAREIKTLVTKSMDQVERGVGLVGETRQAMQHIQSDVTQINAAIGEIAHSAREQATALREVNLAVNQIDQTTQQNAAMVEQTTAATHALAGETASLNQAMNRFQIGNGGSEPLRRRA